MCISPNNARNVSFQCIDLWRRLSFTRIEESALHFWPDSGIKHVFLPGCEEGDLTT
jgi:hypothetical protein